MIENKQKGWHGCYSRIGKNSAEQFHEIIKKDETFDRLNKTIKIKDFFAPDKKINKLDYIEDSLKVFQNYQNDTESIKKYIYFMKISIDLNNKQTINDYIELWNLYLDAYMNDPDAYNELAQIYLMVNEYDKAIFCLEELLLHNPNDYKVLNRIGDIYCSKNNAADAKVAIKYYSRSILINPTPRAFFGIQNCCSLIIQKEKKLDENCQKLLDISKTELTKFYENTCFKDFDVNKIFKV